MVELLNKISSVPSGKQLLLWVSQQLGMEMINEIPQLFRWGSVSKTDAVLTRRLDPQTAAEIRERKITIIIKKQQEWAAVLMDMVHELSHAAAQDHIDPYDPHLSMGQYILKAIEGVGGEVRAVAQECQVALELRLNTFESRCQRYTNKDGMSLQLSLNKIRRDFYAVGHWKGHLDKELGMERKLFPDLHSASPQLISSTGNAPYPVALMEEFLALNRVACQNSYRRLASLKQNRASKTGQETLEFLNKRCGHDEGSLLKR